MCLRSFLLFALFPTFTSGLANAQIVSSGPSATAAGNSAPGRGAAGSAAPSTEAEVLPTVTVIGQLDQEQEEIVPSLGATRYSIGSQEIDDLSEGDNISLSKLVLRFPGVSEDSEGSGSFHVRDEHANVQYRIDGILIPESITSFGSQFGTRFIDHVDLITGALPAEFGFRESGVIDLHTKDGIQAAGGNVEMYGGSQGEISPSLEYGGSQGKLNYYFSGSYLQDSLGIENPTSARSSTHDQTDQYRGLAYLSYVIDNTTRFSFIAGEAYNQFQIPNTPGQAAGEDGVGNPFVISGVASFNSANLNESQREQNNFEILAFQKTIDDFGFQVSLFNSYSAVDFNPDDQGDLFFNGVAGKLNRSVMSDGAQFDASYKINDSHTLRAGFLLNAQGSNQYAGTTVIPEDPATGAQDGNPFTVQSNDYSTAYSYGFYLQDEWTITKSFTLNFGGRFDLYQSSQIRQNQLSPRVNAVYQVGDATTIHGGYASYFTPPPLENIPQGSTTQFANTTNQATPGLPDDPVKSERAQYFDLGVVHHFTPAYQLGLDAYYKISQNTLDDGQFGAAPILSAFNYRRGQICGAELSQIYQKGGLSIYGNVAVEEGIGTQVNSAQSVLFSADDYRYISDHYIYLDHSQAFTGSFGCSYDLKQTETTPYVEMVTGSGLRTDSSVPNGGSLPAYDSVNLGFTQGFKWAGFENITARFDVINVADQRYELRDGAGVGVFAPQYGQRRSFYGGVSYAF